MKLNELKKSGLIDEFQRVILLDFDGHTEKVLEKGYFSSVSNKYDEYNVSISTLSRGRIDKHNASMNYIAIFVEL